MQHVAVLILVEWLQIKLFYTKPVKETIVERETIDVRQDSSLFPSVNYHLSILFIIGWYHSLLFATITSVQRNGSDKRGFTASTVTATFLKRIPNR